MLEQSAESLPTRISNRQYASGKDIEPKRFWVDRRVVELGLTGAQFIGQGSWGTIIEAHDARHQSDVVLKLPLIFWDHLEEEYSEKILKEARLMTTYAHYGILPVYGLAFIPYNNTEIPGIIMKRASGDVSKPMLSLQEIAHITRVTAETLDYLHAHHVAHMSVKGENILTSSSDGHGPYWLTDFGSSIDEELRTETPVANQSLCGPELWQLTADVYKGRTWNWQDVASSDMHQLGVMAYRLITHRPIYNLWESDDAYGYYREDHSKPNTRLQKDDSVPDPIYEILRKATSFRPEDRFQTCMDLAGAVDQEV